ARAVLRGLKLAEKEPGDGAGDPRRHPRPSLTQQVPHERVEVAAAIDEDDRPRALVASAEDGHEHAPETHAEEDNPIAVDAGVAREVVEGDGTGLERVEPHPPEPGERQHEAEATELLRAREGIVRTREDEVVAL